MGSTHKKWKGWADGMNNGNNEQEHNQILLVDHSLSSWLFSSYLWT